MKLAQGDIVIFSILRYHVHISKVYMTVCQNCSRAYLQNLNCNKLVIAL